MIGTLFGVAGRSPAQLSTAVTPPQAPGTAAGCARSDRRAAHRVDARVVARELRGAGGAQPVAEPRDHDLVRFVGEAHAGRGRRLVRSERQRDRVALQRIHRDADTERLEQQAGCSCRARPRRRPHCSPFHRASRPTPRPCRRPLRALPPPADTGTRTPRLRASRASSSVKRCASPDSSSGVVDAADAPVRCELLQRRLEREAFGGRLHLALDAERAHRFGVPRQRLEVGARGGEMQDAARELVVAHAGAAPQRAQAVAAVARRGRRARGCCARSGPASIRRSEAHAPHPTAPSRRAAGRAAARPRARASAGSSAAPPASPRARRGRRRSGRRWRTRSPCRRSRALDDASLRGRPRRGTRRW